MQATHRHAASARVSYVFFCRIYANLPQLTPTYRYFRIFTPTYPNLRPGGPLPPLPVHPLYLSSSSVLPRRKEQRRNNEGTTEKKAAAQGRRFEGLGGGFANGHPEGVRNESQRGDCSTASERLNLNNSVQAVRRSAVIEYTPSQRLEETRHRDNLVVYIRAHITYNMNYRECPLICGAFTAIRV